KSNVNRASDFNHGILSFSKDSLGITFERKNDPNMPEMGGHNIVIIILAIIFIVDLWNSVDLGALLIIALVIVGAAVAWFSQRRKHTMRISNSSFEILKKNTFGVVSKDLSCDISEVDYVYAFEKAPEHNKEGSKFFINIVFKNSSRPIMSVFENIDVATAEFISDNANIEIESRNGFGL
ncbi:MAG: hypothetical protein MJ234_03290, partial [bacterium]|nr:hypothetical protein [bacterium]